MMRFSKFLKVEADIVVARNSLILDETKSSFKPVIFLHPEFAKKSGVREGDVVEVEREGRILKFRVKISENAPENGGIIPNGIFASYLADMKNFKRFKASVEVAEGEESKPEDVLKLLNF